MEDIKELEFQRLEIICKERGIKVEKDDDRASLLKKLTSKPEK